MRDDDWQTFLECLLAVVVVRCGRIERGDGCTGVNYCGTIDKFVPDVLGARQWHALAYTNLIGKHDYNV